jgi:outer membrane lipoprotein-sorting protein
VLACGDRDFRFTLSLDQETGLLLRLETPGDVLEVRSIEYGVRFERGDFRAEPPEGATVVRIGGKR